MKGSFVFIEKYIVSTQIWVAIMFVLLASFFIKNTESRVPNLFLLFTMTQSAYLFLIHRNSFLKIPFKNLYFLFFVVSFLLFVILFFKSDLSFFKLFIVSFFTFLYNINFANKSLRKLAYTKGFLVSLVWSLSIAWLLLSKFYWEIFSAIFFFILPLTWLFDMKSDGKKDTFPVVYSWVGFKSLKWISVLCLAISAVSISIANLTHEAKYAWYISIGIACLLAVYASPKRKDLYFTFIMESLMGLPLLIDCL